MSILVIIFLIVCVGVVLWAINNFIPMQESVKKILNIVIVIILIIYLLKIFGVWGYLLQFKIK